VSTIPVAADAPTIAAVLSLDFGGIGSGVGRWFAFGSDVVVANQN
jgi:hypothetical protein